MGPYRVDVAGSGFAVLDRIYEGTTRTLEEMGGSCGNVLWSLAKLRHRVVPVLSLGEDEVGHRLRHSFDEVGAVTTYVNMRPEIRTPMLAQFVDLAVGEHHFSSVCPETHVRYPKYRPIDTDESAEAASVFGHCSVFYSDRLSDGIVDAMATVSANGGIVFFEPSVIADGDLFERALQYVSVIKCSDERIENLDSRLAGHDLIVIVTSGASGLRTSDSTTTRHLSAFVADAVLDTSGSGDMVSVGVIDHLLSIKATAATLTLDDTVVGLRAGQRLAAANCSFVGARGIFRQGTLDSARQALRS